MNQINALFFTLVFLVVTTVIAIHYKIYLRVKITDPEKKNSSFQNRAVLTDLFPMRIRFCPFGEIKTRKRANIALGIFYLFAVLSLIVSFIIKKIATQA